MLSQIAAAHDVSDADASWYKSLKNNQGAYCCSPQQDCVATEYSADRVGGYVALWRGRWLHVDPSVVLDRSDNPTGHAVICAWDGADIYPEPVVRCFVLPPES
jgi:hypothetical protein